MIRFVRDLRLVPIAVIASVCLLALKTADLVLDRGLPATGNSPPAVDADVSIIRKVPGVPRPSDPQRSWAQQMFNFPDAGDASPSDQSPLPSIAPLMADKGGGDIITGSVGDNNGSGDNSKTKTKDEAAGAAGKDGKPVDAGKDGKPVDAGKDNKPVDAGKDGKPEDAGKDNKPANTDKNGKPASGGKDLQNAAPPNGTVIRSEAAPVPAGAERAILERLQERRLELEKRSRELDIREGLLAETEKRIEARLAEIKDDQAQLVVAAEKKDEAGAARLKGLVTMYENMKARDAAKIFDRLEMSVLMEVVTQINPRRMADILAQMSPETAERLTVELANRAKTVTKDGTSDLPKIEGRPTSQ